MCSATKRSYRSHRPLTAPGPEQCHRAPLCCLTNALQWQKILCSGDCHQAACNLPLNPEALFPRVSADRASRRKSKALRITTKVRKWFSRFHLPSTPVDREYVPQAPVLNPSAPCDKTAVLAITSSSQYRRTLEMIAETQGWSFLCAGTWAEALRVIENHEAGVVLRWPGHSAEFFAEAISLDPVASLDHATYAEHKLDGWTIGALEYTTETFYPIYIPGVANFVLGGSHVQVPKGFRMIWKTHEPGRSRNQTR